MSSLFLKEFTRNAADVLSRGLKRKLTRRAAFTVAAGVASIAFVSAERTLHHRDQAKIAEADFSADAVTVLAGGQNRIKTGIDALGPFQKLLVSGALPGNTDPYKLMNHLEYGFIEKLITADQIEIRANAIDTIGNALEIKQWLKENPDIKNLLIVTSDYHIPRSHLELTRVLPEAINIRFISVESYDAGIGLYSREALKTGCRSIPGCSEFAYFLSGKQHLHEAYEPAKPD